MTKNIYPKLKRRRHVYVYYSRYFCNFDEVLKLAKPGDTIVLEPRSALVGGKTFFIGGETIKPKAERTDAK